jgi:hypothetical protein
MTKNNPELTTEKISQEITPKSSLLSNLIPSYQKTPLTEQQAKRKGLPSTPKSKCRLGIDDDRKIVWPTPNFTPNDHSILTAWGKSQDRELDDILGSIIMTWFEVNRDQITQEADDFIKIENTTDDLLRIAEASRKKYERTMELLRQRLPKTDETETDETDEENETSSDDDTE